MSMVDKYLKMQSNVIQSALNEFKFLGWMDKDGNFDDEMQELICTNVLELLHVMSKQGHSGFSANYLLSMFNKLANGKPLSPLTCKENEWAYDVDGTARNIRANGIYKNKDGIVYQIEGRIFRDVKGYTYISGASKKYIENIPFTPVSEYIDVDGSNEEEYDKILANIKEEEAEKLERIREKIKNGTYIKED